MEASLGYITKTLSGNKNKKKKKRKEGNKGRKGRAGIGNKGSDDKRPQFQSLPKSCSQQITQLGTEPLLGQVQM